MSDPKRDEDDDACILPIEGTLDLHTFAPKDAKEVVTEYVRECHERGLLQLRIIHGKGTGVLRAQVHAVLARLPEVGSFGLAGDGGGGWGATVVTLRPKRVEQG